MFLMFYLGFVDIQKNTEYWQQYPLKTAGPHYTYKRADRTRLILHSLYKIQHTLAVHISAVAVSEQKGIVSDQQCIDQTAFQPVVHLYFTSVYLVQ